MPVLPSSGTDDPNRSLVPNPIFQDSYKQESSSQCRPKSCRWPAHGTMYIPPPWQQGNWRGKSNRTAKLQRQQFLHKLTFINFINYQTPTRHNIFSFANGNLHPINQIATIRKEKQIIIRGTTWWTTLFFGKYKVVGYFCHIMNELGNLVDTGTVFVLFDP